MRPNFFSTTPKGASMHRALQMIDSLYRSTVHMQGARWATAGADIPVSHDATTSVVVQQCGVHTKHGACMCLCQHSVVFCPTHARLANKYTRKYHACTDLLDHSETTISAKKMLRYIVALRTVVYIMYNNATKHKSLDDAAAATHMMPINYFESLLREEADMSVEEFVDQVKVPHGIQMNAAVPLSLEHLLREPRIQEDLFSDTTAEDIVVPKTAPSTTTTDWPRSSASSSSTLSPPRRARNVMSDVSLRPYEESGTVVVDSIEMWVELLRRVDRGNNVQVVLSFPYANRDLEGTIRLTGTVITYLYDAASGKYIFGSDSFYGRDGVKAGDYQVVRIMSSFDASTTAKPTSEEELFSAATQAVVFNAQNCFLIEFTALNAHDHRAMRAYVSSTLLALSQQKRYKRAIRTLLDVETIESKIMSRRSACRFPLLSKRFISNTDMSIKNVFDTDVIQALQSMTKDRKKKMGQINITDPKDLVKKCLSEEIFIETVTSRIKYIASETPTSVSVPEILRLYDDWWKTQPVSTLTVADKFVEQTQQFAENLTKLQLQSKDTQTTMFATQMGPHKMEFLHTIQRQILNEMAGHKQPLRPVLIASDIDKLNKATTDLILE